MSDLLDQFNRRFPNEDACLSELMRIRYGGEFFQCRSCKEHTKYHKVKKRRCFECEQCGFQIFPTAGTAFDKTRTQLRIWFLAMLISCVYPNETSRKTRQTLRKNLKVSYKVAQTMHDVIRGYMAELPKLPPEPR